MTSFPAAMPPFLRRPLFALWISIAVHAAVIGLVRVAPRTVVAMDQVLEARLENPAQEQNQEAEVPLLEATPESEMLISVPDQQPVVLLPLPEKKAVIRPEPSPEPVAINPITEQVRPNNPETVKSEAGPSIDIPLAVDTHYYAARELDVQPRPVRKVVPLYPGEYETQGVNGFAILEMRVETDGSLSDLKIVEIQPAAYGAFGREALAAFKDVKFVPAWRQGRQVRALFRVKVVFEASGD